MNVTILVTVLPFIKISLTYASNFVWKHTKAYAACGSSSGSTLSQYGGGPNVPVSNQFRMLVVHSVHHQIRALLVTKQIIPVEKYTIMTKPEQ